MGKKISWIICKVDDLLKSDFWIFKKIYGSTPIFNG